MIVNNKDDLEKALIDAYQFYYRHRDDKGDATIEGICHTGKCDGGVEAIGAIYLAVFGTKKMDDLWKLTMPEDDE